MGMDILSSHWVGLLIIILLVDTTSAANESRLYDLIIQIHPKDKKDQFNITHINNSNFSHFTTTRELH